MGEQRQLCCEKKHKMISVYDKEQCLRETPPSLDSVFLGNAEDTLG